VHEIFLLPRPGWPSLLIAFALEPPATQPVATCSSRLLPFRFSRTKTPHFFAALFFPAPSPVRENAGQVPLFFRFLPERQPCRLGLFLLRRPLAALFLIFPPWFFFSPVTFSTSDPFSMLPTSLSFIIGFAGVPRFIADSNRKSFGLFCLMQSFFPFF